MGKLFGILLVILAIYVGLTVYDQGVDRAVGGLFAGSRTEAPRHAAAAPPDARASSSPDDSDASAGRARPAPITDRVRERVNGAMEQGARRSAGR